jgi:hypothetical protein
VRRVADGAFAETEQQSLDSRGRRKAWLDNAEACDSAIRPEDSALDTELRLAVDDGGGLHDDAGRRVGAIRRTPSGEWITDRQNPAAHRSEAPSPAD